jgi:rubrerythrin
MLNERFDMERFMASSGKVDLSDICWDEVPNHRLTPEALRTVRYFMRTESATFFYLREIIGTRAAIEDPDFAPFMAAWSYEEEFHGRAFRRFMEAYGEPVDDTLREGMFAERAWGERVDEVLTILLATLFPEDLAAAHMVWGASAEFTTYMGYAALVKRTQHPVLHTICKRIMKQEARHFAFYQGQASTRLAASRRSQHFVTWLLRAVWTPVGDGMSAKDEVYHALRFLFDGSEGDAIPYIEQRVRQLPGLEWFDLFTKYVRNNKIGRAPATWLASAPFSASATHHDSPEA